MGSQIATKRLDDVRKDSWSSLIEIFLPGTCLLHIYKNVAQVNIYILGYLL